jgi:hypothetical protein
MHLLTSSRMMTLALVDAGMGFFIGVAASMVGTGPGASPDRLTAQRRRHEQADPCVCEQA